MQGPGAERFNHLKRILRPLTNAALLKNSARLTMTGVVKTQKRLPSFQRTNWKDIAL